jgi:hypothetical protein
MPELPDVVVYIERIWCVSRLRKLSNDWQVSSVLSTVTRPLSAGACWLRMRCTSNACF